MRIMNICMISAMFLMALAFLPATASAEDLYIDITTLPLQSEEPVFEPEKIRFSGSGFEVEVEEGWNFNLSATKNKAIDISKNTLAARDRESAGYDGREGFRFGVGVSYRY